MRIIELFFDKLPVIFSVFKPARKSYDPVLEEAKRMKALDEASLIKGRVLSPDDLVPGKKE